MTPRFAIVLVAAVLLALTVAADADGRTTTGTVAKVADGDSLKIRIGSRTRTYHLRGIDAPELTGSAAKRCYGTASRARLRKLLPARARVRVTLYGSSRHVRVRRGKTDVNRAMVRGGHARARAGFAALGRSLRADEAAARKAGRGLWKVCGQGSGPSTPGGSVPGQTIAPTPAQPGAGDTVGQPAVDQLTAELRGAFFQRFNNSGGLSEDFALNLCADGRVRYKTNSTFVSGEFTSVTITERFGQPWTVAEALVKADGTYRGARVTGTFTQKRVRDGGSDTTEAINEPAEVALENLNGQWHWDGRPVQHAPGQASCDPG